MLGTEAKKDESKSVRLEHDPIWGQGVFFSSVRSVKLAKFFEFFRKDAEDD